MLLRWLLEEAHVLEHLPAVVVEAVEELLVVGEELGFW